MVVALGTVCLGNGVGFVSGCGFFCSPFMLLVCWEWRFDTGAVWECCAGMAGWSCWSAGSGALRGPPAVMTPVVVAFTMKRPRFSAVPIRGAALG